jgi:fimbrial chaperone protein
MTSFRRLFARLAACLAALAPLAAPLPAVAMTVRPVILDLGVNARTMSQTLTVTNTFDAQLPLELTVREFVLPTELGGRGEFKPTEDVVIFPPQAIIAPGASQGFRIQYVGDPAVERSRHFVVTISQLPVALPGDQSTIQILYNFQVMVSIGVPGQRSQIAAVSSRLAPTDNGAVQLKTVFRNDRPTYGYLSDSRMRIVQRDATGRQVFSRVLTAEEVQQTVGYGLIGPGQTREIDIPVTLPSKDGPVSVEVLLNARRR